MLQYTRPGCQTCVPPKGWPIPKCDPGCPDDPLDVLRAQVVAADVTAATTGVLGIRGFVMPRPGAPIQASGARTTDVTRVSNVPLLTSCFVFPGAQLMQGR